MNFGIKLLGLAAGTVWLAILFIPDNKLHIIFCNVGQGDATLITYKTTQLLVDGGPSNKILSCVDKHMPFWDKSIEMAIVTHSQKDHEFGVVEVAKRYKVISFEPRLRKGQVVNFGSFKFNILWPDNQVLGANTLGTENNEGIVGIVEYGNFDLLLTADADPKVYEDVGKVDVLKVPHHGSKFQWDEVWYERVKPVLAVISVGKNSYGHPAPEVIEGLKKLGISTMRTDLDGEVEIISDGKTWHVVK